MTQNFVRNVKQYAEENNVPIVHFKHGERKDEIAAKMRRKYPAKNGVVFIGVAQEKAYAFKGRKKRQKGYVGFDYSRQSVFVNYYYFYLNDDDFGPAFIKICSYVPFPIKVCLNGHEWAKMFFYKWISLLPYPLTEEDRQCGYVHYLSVWQLEVCLTQVFDRPLRGGNSSSKLFETTWIKAVRIEYNCSLNVRLLKTVQEAFELVLSKKAFIPAYIFITRSLM